MTLHTLFSLAAAGTMLCFAALAQAQVPAFYNHPIAGITILNDGTAVVNPDAFGFQTGSTISFLSGGGNAATGTYALASVRAFSLLYTNNTPVNWAAQNTAAIGSLSFGAQQPWRPDSISGKYTGWEDSIAAQGSQKAGNLGPNSASGLVFQITDASSHTVRRLNASELTNLYGFDLAVTVGEGQADPFGNGVAPGQISTGHVFEALVVTPSAVPEPGSVGLLAGLSVTGAGVVMLRRKRRK